jgi:hypothetical protein
VDCRQMTANCGGFSEWNSFHSPDSLSYVHHPAAEKPLLRKPGKMVASGHDAPGKLAEPAALVVRCFMSVTVAPTDVLATIARSLVV